MNTKDRATIDFLNNHLVSKTPITLQMVKKNLSLPAQYVICSNLESAPAETLRIYPTYEDENHHINAIVVREAEFPEIGTLVGIIKSYNNGVTDAEFDIRYPSRRNTYYLNSLEEGTVFIENKKIGTFTISKK